jgi:hypothetical protein
LEPRTIAATESRRSGTIPATELASVLSELLAFSAELLPFGAERFEFLDGFFGESRTAAGTRCLGRFDSLLALLRWRGFVGGLSVEIGRADRDDGTDC